MDLVSSLKSWFRFNHSLAIIFELLRLGVLLFLKCIVPVAFVCRLVLILTLSLHVLDFKSSIDSGLRLCANIGSQNR